MADSLLSSGPLSLYSGYQIFVLFSQWTITSKQRPRATVIVQ